MRYKPSNGIPVEHRVGPGQILSTVVLEILETLEIHLLDGSIQSDILRAV